MVSNGDGISLLHIEIEKSKFSSRPNHDVELAARQFLLSLDSVANGKIFQTVDFSQPEQRELINKITVFLSNYPADQSFPIRSALNYAVYYVYQSLTDPPCPEEIDEDDDSTVVGSHHWSLPNAEFEGYWENLIFDLNIKEKILNYANTMLKFADGNVDSSIVTSNRLVLFHGPPGTGKTTLCKAVAQKLSIRLAKRYNYSQLLEINSHSLFSKWFSESGKLVMKMFDKIRELLEDEKCLVFVLIDEIESLTKARQSSLSNSEPSDAIRVVNALLTQIDQLRRYRNVMILTTSNLTNAVDDAFLDRADIKQYVGPPSEIAIYKILFSCIKELQQKNLIAKEYISPNPATNSGCGKTLFEISKKLVGSSGRSLRKLPVIAHALIGSPLIVDAATFLKGLWIAVEEMMTDEMENCAEKRARNDAAHGNNNVVVKRSKCSSPMMNGIESTPEDNSHHWNGLFIKEEPCDD